MDNERGPATLLEKPLVLGFPDYSEQARRLAAAAGLPYREVEIHRFPDGESRVRLPPRLPPRVVLCRSLQRPNDKLIELALAARTARGLGAGHLTLIAPYLCYMRQDRAFHPGEAVSQRIVGGLLADWLDALITVDPHLHRISSLGEAVPVSRALSLSAAPLMGRFLRQVVDDPLLIGPDAESRQWVAAIARQEGLDYLIGEKRRLGDREVRIGFDGDRGTGRQMVLIDDVASTGRTLETAVAALRPLRPASVDVLVSHALFLEGTLDRLRAAGVGRVWSTDSIPHATNRLELATLLAGALDT
jgi:ribose-phosphate pyrophosphokinase